MRYEHLNYESLKLLNKNDMVIGQPSVDIRGRVFKGCVYGKICRMLFPKFSRRVIAPLQLLVIGLPSVDIRGRVCKVCVYEKIHRMPFSKFSWRATTPF